MTTDDFYYKDTYDGTWNFISTSINLREKLKNFLIILNKTQHGYIGLTFGHTRGGEWLINKRENYDIESIKKYIHILDHLL